MNSIEDTRQDNASETFEDIYQDKATAAFAAAQAAAAEFLSQYNEGLICGSECLDNVLSVWTELAHKRTLGVLFQVAEAARLILILKGHRRSPHMLNVW